MCGHLKPNVEQRTIEQQYRLRAFIGAVRLQPELQVINPALIPIERLAESDDKNHCELPPPPEATAQEIVASGRDQDVKKLIKRLSEDRYNLTIVHGQSGVGKSSMINAGLVPELKQNPIGDRSVLPIVLRVYKEWIRDLRQCLAEALRERGIQEQTAEVAAADDFQPVIAQLRDNADRRSLLTILVFDQFEEFFFTYPDPRDRRLFFEFLHQCLNHLHHIKVVLSLREDYLHYLLEVYRPDSDGTTNDITKDILGWDKRYPLGNFSIIEAKQLIQRLTQRSQFHLDSDLIDQLVKDLSEELQEVRPIELQVIGAQLQESDITTLEKYQLLGLFPKEKLIEQFLEQVVQDCGANNKEAAELILFLLTDDKGTRPLKTLPELTTNLQAWELTTNPHQLELVLDILVMAGLVVEIPDIPDKCYQLVHDYLATLIRRNLKQKVDDYVYQQKLEKVRELDRIQNAEARERDRKRQKRILIVAGIAISLGIPAIGLALFSIDQRNKAAVSEIEATTALSSGQFTANSQLEALRNSVKAGIQLKNQQNQLGTFLLNLEQVRAKTIGNLMATVYSTQESNRFIGHRLWVNGISYNPKAQIFASASADNTIILWDRNGRLLNRLKNHTGAVNSVSFSPDGQQIASASDDKTIKLWDLNGKELKTLTGHQFPVTSVSFSPGGHLLASASDDGTVKLWDTQGGRELKTFAGHRDRVKAVSFSRTGQIATASWDGTIRLWRQDGVELKRLTSELIQLCEASKTSVNLGAELNQAGVNVEHLCSESNQKFTSVSVSPDGKTIAAGSWDNTIKLWNANGELLQTLKGHSDLVTHVSFSPDGKTITSASNDGTVKLWDSHTGIIQSTLRIPGVISAGFVDNKTLVSTGADGIIKLWNLEGVSPDTVPYETPVTSVSFSPDGQWIASASKSFGQDSVTLAATTKSIPSSRDSFRTLISGQIKLWNINGKLPRSFSIEGSFVSIKFNSNRDIKPDQPILASAENSIDSSNQVKSQVKLWNLDGKELKKLSVKGLIADISFSPDGKMVAIAENIYPDRHQTAAKIKGKVTLWKIDASTPFRSLVAHEDKINSISISKDGIIATASSDSTVKLWNQDGYPIKTLRGHANSANSVSFSPDGKTLASAGADNSIKLWNLAGQELKTISGNTSSVLSVSFSHDGKLLVSGSDDGTIKVWNVSDGLPLATLKKNDRQVNSVSFSPLNNHLIASAGNDNRLSIWQFDLDSLLKRGCAWLHPYLLNAAQDSNDKELCEQLNTQPNRQSPLTQPLSQPASQLHN
ncbi:hypothetical protein K9N68_19255 [Kovacikia minuta CCNUW1]|uniref:WD40 domain-containing protein n=1 Tax=Kovacikia minuta TaxID=2931930 RepID=UPI001CCDE2B9|nr:hypothetical protein [Kovacikia minuta]UBF23886.1 hypothetical protein K9N68_19255 [Kovacikia minuta CCNUW1]